MQLQSEHSLLCPSFHRIAQAGEARLAKTARVVGFQPRLVDPLGVRHFKHHAKRHHWVSPALIPEGLQQHGKPAKRLGLFQRPRAPVIAFKHQDGKPEYRLAPSCLQRPGKSGQDSRPQQQ